MTGNVTTPPLSVPVSAAKRTMPGNASPPSASTLTTALQAGLRDRGDVELAQVDAHCQAVEVGDRGDRRRRVDGRSGHGREAVTVPAGGARTVRQR